jgi:hypothetical protein
VRGVFEILLEQSEPMRAADVLKEVERRVPPTDFENDTYPSSPVRYPLPISGARGAVRAEVVASVACI